MDNLHYEKFQDGTVKCIEDEIPFEVPEGWEWSRIGSVFNTVTGSTPSTKIKEYYGDDYPFYKPTDLDNGYNINNSTDHVSEVGFRAGRPLAENSVLVTCIGATIGKTGLIHTSGICNQQINAILPSDNMNSGFTFFCMCSEYEQNQIISNASATTLPILNKSRFDMLLFIVPPIQQQNKITNEINRLLELVSALEENKESLQETISNTKIKILDLAIRGKLVPQNQNDEPASVLLERIRTEKEELTKQGKLRKDKKESIIYKGDDNSYYEQVGSDIRNIDDEIPFEIPDNWIWCRLKSLSASVENAFVDGPFGSNLKTEHYTTNREVRIAQLNNIGILEWKNTGKKYTTYTHAETISRCISKPGDLVIAKMMPAGRTIILPDIEATYVISSDCVRLRPSPLISSLFLLYMINSNSINSLILENVQGIGRTRTSLGKLKELLVPIPPFPEQKQIVKRIQEFYSFVKYIECSIE